MDYAIIGLIVLSTVEVFLSTYDGIVEKYGKWLHFVDYFTTFFFTIEVSLRIWCADLLDVFNEAFEPEVKKELPPEMVTRRKGHDFGFGDYIN